MIYVFLLQIFASLPPAKAVLGTEDKKINDRNPAFSEVMVTVILMGKARFTCANMPTEGRRNSPKNFKLTLFN